MVRTRPKTDKSELPTREKDVIKNRSHIINKNKKRRNYTKESMISAVNAVKKGMHIRKACLKFGIPSTSLRDVLSGRSRFLQNLKQNSETKVLTSTEEAVLLRWATYSLLNYGLRPTETDFLNSIQNLLAMKKQDNVIKKSLEYFSELVHNYPALPIRKDPHEKLYLGKAGFRRWFQYVYSRIKKKMSSLDIFQDLSRVFSTDGRLVQYCESSGDIIGLSDLEDCNKEESGSNFTFQLTFSANGASVMPMIVYPPCLKDPLTTSKKTIYSTQSDNGRMNGDAFNTFIENVFNPWLLENSITKPVLLLADGETTPITMQLSTKLQHLGIILYFIPLGTKATLQPLDLESFKPFDSYWAEAVFNFQRYNPYRPVRCRDFCSLLERILASITSESIIKRFRSTGLLNFDGKIERMFIGSDHPLNEDNSNRNARRINEGSTNTRRLNEDKTNTGRIGKDNKITRRISKDNTNTRRISKDNTNTRRISKDNTNTRRIGENNTNTRRIEEDKTNNSKIDKDNRNTGRIGKDNTITRRISKDNTITRRISKENTNTRRIGENNTITRRIEEDKTNTSKIDKANRNTGRIDEDNTNTSRIEEDSTRTIRFTIDEYQLARNVLESIMGPKLVEDCQRKNPVVSEDLSRVYWDLVTEVSRASDGLNKNSETIQNTRSLRLSKTDKITEAKSGNDKKTKAKSAKLSKSGKVTKANSESPTMSTNGEVINAVEEFKELPTNDYNSVMPPVFDGSGRMYGEIFASSDFSNIPKDDDDISDISIKEENLFMDSPISQSYVETPNEIMPSIPTEDFAEFPRETDSFVVLEDEVDTKYQIIATEKATDVESNSIAEMLPESSSENSNESINEFTNKETVEQDECITLKSSSEYTSQLNTSKSVYAELPEDFLMEVDLTDDSPKVIENSPINHIVEVSNSEADLIPTTVFKPPDKSILKMRRESFQSI